MYIRSYDLLNKNIKSVLTCLILLFRKFLIILNFTVAVQSLQNNRCPGMYCGRRQVNDGNVSMWSACGACPRGSRANSSSACHPCNGKPDEYAWLYLGFMALLPLSLHWYYIDLYLQSR